MQGVRRYATTTTPAGQEKKSSSTLLYAAIALAGAGTGYYFYTAGAAPKAPLPPAIPTLTGDWVDLKLAKIEQVSPNTKRLRFELPSENHVSGLRIASALLTRHKGPNDQKATLRPYTPVSDEGERGKAPSGPPPSDPR